MDVARSAVLFIQQNRSRVRTSSTHIGAQKCERWFTKQGIQRGGVSVLRERWFDKYRKQHGEVGRKRRLIGESGVGRKHGFGRERDFGFDREREADDSTGWHERRRFDPGRRSLVNAAATPTATVGVLVSGGVRENAPAWFRCSACLIGFVLPTLPLCIAIGFGVANVPQHLWLDWVWLRCFAVGAVVPGGVE